jgi:hypothetical protein
VPPDALLENPQYEIDYVSQLAQAQKRSQLNSLVTALTMAGQMSQFSPEIIDKVDPDKTVNEVWDIVGAPVRVLRDDEEVALIRENRARQMDAANKLAMMESAVNTSKSAAETDKVLAEAATTSRGTFE